MSQTGKHWQNELDKSGFAGEVLTTGADDLRIGRATTTAR